MARGSGVRVNLLPHLPWPSSSHKRNCFLACWRAADGNSASCLRKARVVEDFIERNGLPGLQLLQGIGRHLVESAGLNGSFEFLINHSGSPCLEQARRGGCGGLCWNRDIWMGRICFWNPGEGDEHNEKAWAKRLPVGLRFLVPGDVASASPPTDR